MKYTTRRNEIIRFFESNPTREQWVAFRKNYTPAEIRSYHTWKDLPRNAAWRQTYGPKHLRK